MSWSNELEHRFGRLIDYSLTGFMTHHESRELGELKAQRDAAFAASPEIQALAVAGREFPVALQEGPVCQDWDDSGPCEHESCWDISIPGGWSYLRDTAP